MSSSKLSVYICGSHCAGKTTLQNALQQHKEFAGLNFKSQEEIARAWMVKQGYTQEMLRDPATLLPLEKKFLELQVHAERNELSKDGRKYTRFLWDRGVPDCLTYTRLFCGKNKVEECKNIPGVTEQLKRLKESKDTLVFVPKPEKEFIISDGIRPDSEMEELLQIHQGAIDMLTELEIPFVIVNAFDLDQRVEFVLNEVKRKWPLIFNNAQR